MTPLSYAVEFLAISQALLAGGAPTPLASFPLKPGEDYHMYVSARINGSEFTCGLDSGGGDRIYLDRGKASAVGIQPTSESRSANPQTATMSTDARAKVTLELGSLKLSDQTLVMQNRPYAAFACNIGLGVLRQYVVEWDYDAPALRVYDAALYKYSGPGREVPFTLQQGSPFVNATPHLSQRRSHRGEVGGGHRRRLACSLPEQELHRWEQHHEQGIEGGSQYIWNAVHAAGEAVRRRG